MSDTELNEACRIFDALKQQYYHAWYRFHPETGVDAGDEASAELLRPYSDEDAGALLALNKKLAIALSEIDLDELDEERRYDHRIMAGAVELEILDHEERDWRYRDPSRYLPVYAIYQLLIHPVPNVQRAMKHRLEKIPDHLRGARLQLSIQPETVVPDWLHAAIDEAKSGAAFIRELVHHPLMAQQFSNPTRLQPVCDAAAHALEEFAVFLKSEVTPKAAGEFACGEELFDRRLNSQHFLGIDHDRLLRFGERLFEETRTALSQHAARMSKSKSVQELLKDIQKKRPKPSALLDHYRKRMQEAHRWVESSDLVTMPETQSLKVQETPSFLRSMIPFAAYQPPSITDQKQHGLYYVTLTDDEEQLAEHNNYSIDLTCVHEAFPGHHLQFVIANRINKDNPSRIINTSASMYEGWALYCEQLAIEHGFIDRKEHIFIMLRDRLWRALRIIIDVKLQTGQISHDEAVQMLCDELSFEAGQAKGEIHWYSMSPTIPSCYAVGREMILAARKICVEEGDMQLRVFHDGLLAKGSIALPLAIYDAFGQSVWDATHRAVFG